ncbi:hypothetical protein SDC9_56036 [bioreactor metagenome]|uniref:Phage tail collar domain-containing protein n=1 Tax=bioreactor metagenome TaxID=1076179 RepID=A0A644X6D3_9ZZZZ
MNKFLSIIFFIAIICSASHSHSGAITDSEFSATTLASLNNVTAKSSGGNPVGTIIAWPVTQNPEDMENWLECNGQAVNQAAYPELYSIIGAHLPDLRGQFLRGQGGNSGKLGEVQNYGTYVPNATVIQNMNNLQLYSVSGAGVSPGAQYLCAYLKDGDWWANPTGREWTSDPSCNAILGGWGEANSARLIGSAPSLYGPNGSTSFTSTQTISTGVNETRPTNIAVRYLIRALP